MDKPLPEFEDPPVSEVAISVQFSALANWRGPYGGVFWGLIRSDYPKTQAATPLPYQVENLEELNFQKTLTVQFGDQDLQRIWFLSEDETRLIQIQKDRFVVNWRRVLGNEVYPRYEIELRPRFIKEWGRFRKFVSDNNLGQINDIQADVTYVNDFVQGKGWDVFQDALTFFSNWQKKGSIGFLPDLETLSMAGSYLMSPGVGRLYFMAQHVLRQTDNKQAVQLRLVAKGSPASDSDEDILKWVDLAREWIVQGFTDLTSKSAHRLWKRTR